METVSKRSLNAEACSELAQRATWFVTQADAGKHADKRTAQRFACCIRTAQMLRRGHGWTLARLEQARRIFGPIFDQMVFGPLTGQGRGLDDISHHVAEFDAAYERLKRCVVGGPYQPRLDAVAARDAAQGNGPALPRTVVGVPVGRGSDERSGDAAERVKEAAE